MANGRRTADDRRWTADDGRFMDRRLWSIVHRPHPKIAPYGRFQPNGYYVSSITPNGQKRPFCAAFRANHSFVEETQRNRGAEKQRFFRFVPLFLCASASAFFSGFSSMLPANGFNRLCTIRSDKNQLNHTHPRSIWMVP